MNKSSRVSKDSNTLNNEISETTMFSANTPIKERLIWERLEQHRTGIGSSHMRDLFAADEKRFSRFSVSNSGILLDYSKNIVNQVVMTDLFSLARDCGLQEQIERIFTGEQINNTEKRSVLHTALRNRGPSAVYVQGENVMPDVKRVLDKMRPFTEKVRLGDWRGVTGKPITDIVNIGIGGSDLGPAMAVLALNPYVHENLHIHFISNVDGSQIEDKLSNLNYETTLFVVVSKTFTTQETLTNAKTARQWFLDLCNDPNAVAKHFAAVSTNHKAVSSFGIDPKNMFEFWDWVGGRYSLWSAVGLSLALAIGMDGFEELLEGGYIMDQHFRTTPFEENMPVILAMLGIWYRNFFGTTSQLVAPYDHRLQRLPAFLQQLEMESNGKSTTMMGRASELRTCPVIWGEPGTNGQHAFFQLLHQGTDLIPTDFIILVKEHHSIPSQHQLLLANCIAQSESLMKGKRIDEVRDELLLTGLAESDIETLAPFKVFPGNRPSNTLMLDELTPKILGSLLALYEHKVFVQGVIWDINSFDQWGVELGKELAKTIADELDSGLKVSSHDSSTNGLLNHLLNIN